MRLCCQRSFVTDKRKETDDQNYLDSCILINTIIKRLRKSTYKELSEKNWWFYLSTPKATYKFLDLFKKLFLAFPFFQQDICYVKGSVQRNWKQFLSVTWPTKYLRKKILDPRNTHENKCWTHKRTVTSWHKTHDSTKPTEFSTVMRNWLVWNLKKNQLLNSKHL